MDLPQLWCRELLYVSYHSEKQIMKTKIDWALGADIRVRGATHIGASGRLRLCRLVRLGVRCPYRKAKSG
jgi:hypothetical protein